MIERLKQPQLAMLVLGGWLVVFGLSGMVARPAETLPADRPTTNTSNRLRVVPATQRPGSTGNQLQGAQNLQSQSGDLQQQSSSDLQPNSGLSDFPSSSNQLQ